MEKSGMEGAHDYRKREFQGNFLKKGSGNDIMHKIRYAVSTEEE